MMMTTSKGWQNKKQNLRPLFEKFFNLLLDNFMAQQQPQKLNS